MKKKTIAAKKKPKETTPKKKRLTRKTASGKKKTPAKKAAEGRTQQTMAAVKMGTRAVAAKLAMTGGIVTQPDNCTIKTRKDVSRIVIDFLVSIGFQNAVEANDFDTEIPVSKNGRRLWAAPIRKRVEDKGCNPGTFGSDDCANANTVGDIVDALAEAMNVS